MAKPADDKNKKKKPATPDDIMSTGQMKTLLKLAKKDGGQVSAVVCLTEDNEGVILLHKKMKPKGLRAALIKQAKEVGLELSERTIRFGRATQEGGKDVADDDEDDGDDKTLLFTVNKEPSGSQLEIAIRKRVKPAGFSAVVFSKDEALETESDTETDTASSTAQAPAPSAAPAEAPGAEELAQLARRLAGLIPQVATAPADMKATLVPLAQAAGAAVKGGSPDALAKVDELEAAVLQAAKAKTATDTVGTAGAVTYAKSRLAWIATRKKMEADIDKLRAQIVETYKDAGIAPDLEKRYADRVKPLLANLDEVSPIRWTTR